MDRQKKVRFRMSKEMRLALAILFGIILFIVTLVGALAFSIDANDELYLKAGDSVEGIFVIEDFVPGTLLASNLDWVSLDKDKYISEKAATGTKIVEDNYAISYWVNVPQDADVGIHRAVITVAAGEQVKYFNIKISVENPFVNDIHKALMKPSTQMLAIVVFIFVLLIFLLVSYLRGRSR